MKIKTLTTWLCEFLDISRQYLSKAKQNAIKRKAAGDVAEFVTEKTRRKHPKMGYKKIYRAHSPELRKLGFTGGRDKFGETLKERNLLVERPSRKFKTTTYKKGSSTPPNLIKNMRVTAPNQAWVGDITYVDTYEGPLYLPILSDLFSHKVMGFDVSDTLAATGALAALKMALKSLPEGCKPIHHTDRGSQYCAIIYVNELNKYGIRRSMTEKWHCYENAQAERLNGILKQEYGLGQRFPSKAAARRAIAQAIELYNRERPHASLNYNTPEAVHSGIVAV